MKSVTSKRIHVNRTATAWLIRRVLDPAAEIVFVEPDEVAGVQERDDAIGFDAPGARYRHHRADRPWRRFVAGLAGTLLFAITVREEHAG